MSSKLAARKSSVAEVVLCTAILTLAAYLRFWHVTTLNGGFLSMDEAAVTRTTVSSIVHFERVDTGATYLTHAWMLDTWYRFFGISTSSPRYYTATVALLGLVFFFAALRLVLATQLTPAFEKFNADHTLTWVLSADEKARADVARLTVCF